MSVTNAAAVEALQLNLDKARELFAKRLLPAKLKVDGDEGIKNGRILKAWLVRKDLQGSLAAMSPQAIADELYRAVVADVQSELPQMAWVTPPRALTKRAEQKGPVKIADVREASSLEERVRASEVKDKQDKAQEQAKRRCLGLVERFSPIKRGRLVYELRDSKQKEWREQIAKAGDFEKLEKALIQEQTAIYDKLERAEQRLQ
jgi:hypothetical protein